MIGRVAFLASCLACCVTTVFSLESLTELWREWELADEKTLVVFDVDEVLITTEDHFMHPYAKYVFFPMILKHIWMATSKEEEKDFEEALSFSYLLPKKLLIEEETPLLIKQLQEKGVEVLALTSFPIGSIGLIPDIAAWRVNLLKEFNLSFSRELGKSFPLLREGVLFAEGHKKGDVLRDFFAYSGFYPSKVIFIDDLLSNVENVKSAMDSLGIECSAYQYMGANRFFKEKVDEDVLMYQVKQLIEKKQWISDKEVKRLGRLTNSH